MGVDKMGADKMGVDKMGVDEMGVDKMGSCLSGNKPMAVFSLMIAFIVLVGGINCFFTHF